MPRAFHDLRRAFSQTGPTASRPAEAPLPVPQYFNIEQAAAYLNTTVRNMRRLTEGRRIRHTKVGRELRFRPAWLDAYAESRVIEPEVW